MSIKLKVALITTLLAIPAALTGRIIWPPDPIIPFPPPTLFPFYAFLALFEAISFGLGISFLIYGWKYVQKVSQGQKRMAVLLYISIAWMLINWWPHDNLHQHIGMDLNRLIYLEYGFHLTLIIAGMILGYHFFKIFKSASK